MAFTYTAGGTGTHRVRLRIADTSATAYVFEDAELQSFLDMEEADERLGAALALRTLAADAAKRAVWYQLHANSIWMDRRSISQHLLAVADKLESRALSAPYEYESILDAVIDYAGIDRSQYADSQSDP